MKLRLTKQFVFEMAHALPAYNGKCANLHGHSYHLRVTVEGDAPKPGTDGMVMDFAELKVLVEKCIVEPFDHSLVLPDTGCGAPDLGPYSAKLHLTPFQPTTENLLMHFAALLEPQLPQGVRLHSMALSETDTSTAEIVL
ncbi:MAG: 6-carboxytetrahydropterin synthase [Bacteroidales bacterium]|nr:6-carboxytetrahydropterin synthase [Bacteroidales bacterium]